MPVITRQIGPCFAAEVEGVDMTQALSHEDVAAIHALAGDGPTLAQAV